MQMTSSFWESATPENVQAELANGADPNARDKNGWTPLHWAASSNQNPAEIEALLDAGAGPPAKTSNGETALDFIQEN